MEQNEFKINPKYRNRPMAYLRAEKTILYNEVSIRRWKTPGNEPESDRKQFQIGHLGLTFDEFLVTFDHFMILDLTVKF